MNACSLEGKAAVVTGWQQIQAVHMMKLYYAAKIEATTAMRHSSGRSALASLKHILGVRVQNKLYAIRECRTLLIEQGVLSGKDTAP